VTEHPAEAVIRFRSTLGDAAMSEILAGLIQEGIHVAQFRELHSDLEDAFLSVTRQDSAPGERAPEQPAVANSAGGVN
jgi:ABC-2 type transport system ATP-binding protein